MSSENTKNAAFQEYPKVVYPAGREPVTVQDAAEEERVMGKKAPEIKKPKE